MKLQLIDVKTEEEEAQFGTCELCFSYGYVDNPTYIFKKSNGDLVKIDGYWWDWGDYDEVSIDNAINFNEWLEHQEYNKGREFDTDWLVDAFWKYDDEYGETGFRDYKGNIIYADSEIEYRSSDGTKPARISDDGFQYEVRPGEWVRLPETGEYQGVYYRLGNLQVKRPHTLFG